MVCRSCMQAHTLTDGTNRTMLQSIMEVHSQEKEAQAQDAHHSTVSQKPNKKADKRTRNKNTRRKGKGRTANE
eukprot:m.27942 g.27942  ORF g.27942 m.27942 type:complete len:73 (+) comp9409_c0_seq6:1465-1683(+)